MFFQNNIGSILIYLITEEENLKGWEKIRDFKKGDEKSGLSSKKEGENEGKIET